MRGKYPNLKWPNKTCSLLITPCLGKYIKIRGSRKCPPATLKKKKEKVWVVFCVHDDTNAYLETYPDNKIAVYHKPEWFISLNNVQHVSPTICAQDQEFEFVLTLSTEVVRLAAPSWDQMLDWVESLKSKLCELRILNPKENVYTKLPEKAAMPLLPTRDPTSPLPPTPPVPPEILPGVTQLDDNRQGSNIMFERRQSESQESETPQTSASQTVSSASSSSQVFNFEPFNYVLEGLSNSSPSHNFHYEHLFESGPSNRNAQSRQLSRTDPSVNNLSNRLLERSASCSPRILQPPPQRYKPLREQQVLMLRKEMKHPAGIKLQLKKKDCLSSIGFVDAFEAVWICGWKQKEHPMLYSALHIGDCLISIEGVAVKSSADVYKVLKSHYCGSIVNILIRRLPHAKVYMIHRETEGQALGLIRENNTAVIESVEPNSLAARHGLTSRTKSCDGTSFTNWVLTEINGRPLNLFFKKDQVRDRLNSVGRDISILVQPLDLIKELKKQMKYLKGYKDYLLQ